VSAHNEETLHLLPADLVPGDVVLHDGNWITVTGTVHDVALRQVRIAATRQIGTPVTVRVAPSLRLWTVRRGEPVPEI
jgi:hypothetical protein